MQCECVPTPGTVGAGSTAGGKSCRQRFVEGRVRRRLCWAGQAVLHATQIGKPSKREREDAECFFVQKGVGKQPPKWKSCCKGSKWEGLGAEREAKSQCGWSQGWLGRGPCNAYGFSLDIGSRWKVWSSGVTWLDLNFRSVTQFKEHFSVRKSDRGAEKGALLAIAVTCVWNDGWWWWR